MEFGLFLSSCCMALQSFPVHGCSAAGLLPRARGAVIHKANDPTSIRAYPYINAWQRPEKNHTKHTYIDDVFAVRAQQIVIPSMSGPAAGTLLRTTLHLARLLLIPAELKKTSNGAELEVEMLPAAVACCSKSAKLCCKAAKLLLSCSFEALLTAWFHSQPACAKPHVTSPSSPA